MTRAQAATDQYDPQPEALVRGCLKFFVDAMRFSRPGQELRFYVGTTANPLEQLWGKAKTSHRLRHDAVEYAVARAETPAAAARVARSLMELGTEGNALEQAGAVYVYAYVRGPHTRP